MADIAALIDGLNASDRVKADAKAVYALIAEAESRVHGRPVSEIHFHEVGALDAVADVAAVCLLIFLFSRHHGSISAEFGKLNWTALVLGIVIVGLEVGYIFIYRAGWQVSSASVTANICLACVLLLVGAVAFIIIFYRTRKAR